MRRRGNFSGIMEGPDRSQPSPITALKGLGEPIMTLEGLGDLRGFWDEVKSIGTRVASDSYAGTKAIAKDAISSRLTPKIEVMQIETRTIPWVPIGIGAAVLFLLLRRG